MGIFKHAPGQHIPSFSVGAPDIVCGLNRPERLLNRDGSQDAVGQAERKAKAFAESLREAGGLNILVKSHR